MSTNLRPTTISVPVKDGKTVINYDVFVDPESGLDVDPQSGEMRTREQTIEMVQSVYNVGADSMADELDRYNKWIQDPENKAKSQKLMTANKPIATNNNHSDDGFVSTKNNSSTSSTSKPTVFTPEMALEKAAECRKRGNDWLGQKEYRKALRVYSEGLAYLHVSQRCGMLLSNRAEVLLKLERFDEAAAGAEEAMRRFELLAAAGVVDTSATSKQQQSKTSTTTTTSSGGSTMEVIEDDSSDDDDDDDFDEEEENDKPTITISNISSLLALPLSSSESDDNNNNNNEFLKIFSSRHHSLPSKNSVGPPKSGGAAGQNLRILWLKAAFRLVRALEGSGQTWKALSVVLGLLRKVMIISSNKNKNKKSSTKENDELPNEKEWKETGQRLLAKLNTSGVTKIIQIPSSTEKELRQKTAAPSSSSSGSTTTTTVASVAAPAVENWPSFNTFSIKKGAPTNTAMFAPLFGWNESASPIQKLQSFIREKFLLPVLEEQKDLLHPSHCLPPSSSASSVELESISKSLGVDSFAPFLLHMANLLVDRKTEDEAKAFVVDGPVSLDRWLGRRPQFSYPVKESKESDFFFVVSEVAARVVEWMHDISEKEFSDYIYPVHQSPGDISAGLEKEIREILPMKMKTFAFTQERTVHVVFALSQIAHATRCTRNLFLNNNSSAKQQKEQQWCWLESCLVDVSSRVNYDTALQKYLSTNEDQEEAEKYLKISEINFPSQETKSTEDPNLSFGTFSPSTWGSITLLRENCNSKEENKYSSSFSDHNGDGDKMIPIFGCCSVEMENGSVPKKFGHAGFYGEICI